ncbi:major facilitator superfamily transporter [Colletotrichum karsti]|uniref:Major facilitator superfamily transporter n=1 Tax=Colletotrichum karsti TaxID=1095194 RepID=A0A9P6IHZ7_9PEZI|nr:major facilitator superfamily transporter [Colletotrichum karsti]KAF9879505.1 major facilitator superfamily transporter [Colletotrichum karsti]
MSVTEKTPSSVSSPVPEEEPVQAEGHDLPMDHGTIAWLQVLGCWILFANTWGLSNSFGVFQAYYTTELLPDDDPSKVAWIGSIQIFLMMLIGVCAGWLLDAGYLKFILICGTALTSLGLFMLSLCTEYWQILLAQAFCVGSGSGLLGLTSVAIIPLYFQRKRMVATGIAATGSSLAGIIYPIIERKLIPAIGFAWAVRVFAFIVTGSLLVCIAILRLRPNHKRRGALFRLKHFRDTPYVMFCIAFALMIGSVYVPFFFIDAYAIRLGVDPNTSYYILSAMNAASLLGRLAPNWLADKYGGMTVMIPCCIGSAIVLFLFRFAHSLPGLIVISIAYGFISGGMVSLPPATIANLTDDLSEYGTRMGMGYTIASLGALIGNPIGGAAQNRREGADSTEAIQKEFQGTWIFAGGFISGEEEDHVCQQVVFYSAGVGTGDGVNILERGRQATFGNGLVSDVIKAYHFIVTNYSPHDEIFCFGFSRGAYTARAVAGLITDIGIIHPHELDDFPDLYRLYQNHSHNDSFNFRQSKAYRQWITGKRKKGLEHLLQSPNESQDQWEQVPHTLPPEFTRVVQVVGVFDTVGALGIAYMSWTRGLMNEVARRAPFLGIDGLGFHNPSLSRYIKHAYHALALDEHKTAFTPTLWRLPLDGEQCTNCSDDRSKEDLAKDFRRLLTDGAMEDQISAAWKALIRREMSDQLKDDQPTLQQVWFPGSHINIGGGNPGILLGAPFDCEQLALISFTWMCDQISPFLKLDDEPRDDNGDQKTLSTLADREIASRGKLIEFSRQLQGLSINSALQLTRQALNYAGILKTDEGNDKWALGPIIMDSSAIVNLAPTGFFLANRTPGEYRKDDAGNDFGETNEAIHPSVFYRHDHLKSYNPGSLKDFTRSKKLNRSGGGQVQYLYEWRKGNLMIPEYVIKPEDRVSRQLADRSMGGKEFVGKLLTDHYDRM